MVFRIRTYMFDQLEVNFKSLKLIRKCKKKKRTKLGVFCCCFLLNNSGCVGCSTASNAVLLCFSHISWMDFLESSLVTQFCGTPKFCSSWWLNIQTTHLLLFRKWFVLIPQLLQLCVDMSFGQVLIPNDPTCIHLELCIKI